MGKTLKAGAGGMEVAEIASAFAKRGTQQKKSILRSILEKKSVKEKKKGSEEGECRKVRRKGGRIHPQRKRRESSHLAP